MLKSQRKKFGVRSVTVSIVRALDHFTGSLARLAVNKKLGSKFVNHDTSPYAQNVFTKVDTSGAKQVEVDLNEVSLRMSADASCLTIAFKLPFEIIAMPGASAVIEVEATVTGAAKLGLYLNKTTLTEIRNMGEMERDTFSYSLPLNAMREENTLILSVQLNGQQYNQLFHLHRVELFVE